MGPVEKSTADVREKWRDIANVVREGDALDRSDELPEILQMMFWFGAVSGTAKEDEGGRSALVVFLPESSVDAMFRPGRAARKRDSARASAGRPLHRHAERASLS